MSSGENERLAGRYRVIEQLGRGGMGVVWRAVDEVLGREVAVKELRTYTDSSAPELADLTVRMQREARAAARVRHPSVIAVHDVAEHEGRPVIVMELIDGPSLDDVLRERGVLDAREAAAIGARVMEALDAAHRVGVLHRDVKPGNVLLDRGGSSRAAGNGGGRVVLTDFGIAAMDDPGDGSTTHLTRSGELVGSLDYLAPERAQGHEPGPASDIWALGATLYAAVEGASPFRRTSTWSTLTAIVVDPLPEPQRAGALGPVLQQLMHKDPAQRPDADTAARLLAAVAAGEDAGNSTVAPGAAVPPQRPEPSPRVPTVLNAMPHRPEGFGPAMAQPEQPPQPSAPMPAAPPAPAPDPAAASGGRGRARALVAAGVVAVLLAGGGVTYALVDREGATTTDLAGGSAESPSARSSTSGDPAASPSAGDRERPSTKPTGKGGKKSPTPSAAPPAPGKGPGGSAGSDSTASGGGSAGSGGGVTTGGGATGGTTTSGGGSTSTNGGSTTGGSDPDPAPVCHAIGGSKYNCEVWRTANSYTASGTRVGTLNAGLNYFYCQQNLGRRETSGQWTNVWWAKTDDDSGNTNVFVSDVYIEGGDNDAPVPGLPVC
ncbi:serine/threonine protein kinase [Streptomyces sp. NBC_01142]|uniref:serine/threonine-protein kinase n=1 Tax=Streptomyces sp. NBC_01142 TaxID=2975865 RepID=UPI0022567FA5|nr:serine/threonine-protein kinase [Streptomyces sp. NBC_01142]MCX4825085.1 serine/threonine protein kinase [Streptomyces sp. NBC_01142]